MTGGWDDGIQRQDVWSKMESTGKSEEWEMGGCRVGLLFHWVPGWLHNTVIDGLIPSTTCGP